MNLIPNYEKKKYKETVEVTFPHQIKLACFDDYASALEEAEDYISKYKRSNLPSELSKYIELVDLIGPTGEAEYNYQTHLLQTDSASKIKCNELLEKYDWPTIVKHDKKRNTQIIFCILDSRNECLSFINSRISGPGTIEWQHNPVGIANINYRNEKYYYNGQRLSEPQVKQMKIKLLGLL